MGITELFLVGVGLSMDAFAVAICRGLGMKRLEWRQAFLVAVFFGGFQALMPRPGLGPGQAVRAVHRERRPLDRFSPSRLHRREDDLGRFP